MRYTRHTATREDWALDEWHEAQQKSRNVNRTARRPTGLGLVQWYTSVLHEEPCKVQSVVDFNSFCCALAFVAMRLAWNGVSRSLGGRPVAGSATVRRASPALALRQPIRRPHALPLWNTAQRWQSSSAAPAHAPVPLSSRPHAYLPTVSVAAPLAMAVPPPKKPAATTATAASASSSSPAGGVADGARRVELASGAKRFEPKHVSRFGFGGTRRGDVPLEITAERVRSYLKRGGNTIDFISGSQTRRTAAPHTRVRLGSCTDTHVVCVALCCVMGDG